MHLYKLNLLSQQGKLYLKAKTWILQCSRNSLFVNHRYLNQRNMRWGDLGLMFPFFLKLCGFIWRKRSLTLIKFAHTTAKAVKILLSWKYCPDNFVFKEQTEGEGFGEGFEEVLHTRGFGVGLQVWITGMHPLEVVGPPKSRNLLDWWLNQPAPRRSLHNHCFICISLFSYLLFNWSFHFQPGWDWCELCS